MSDIVKQYEAEAQDDLSGLMAWAKENKLVVGATGLILFGLMTGGSENYAQQTSAGAQLQQQRIEADQTLRQQKLEAELYQQALEVGQMRQPHCIYVEPVANPTSRPAGISEGMTVTDPDTGAPLPDGTFVCDQYGWTGVIRSGAITSLAPAPQQYATPVPQPSPQPVEQKVIQEEPIYVPVRQ